MPPSAVRLAAETFTSPEVQAARLQISGLRAGDHGHSLATFITPARAPASRREVTK